MSRAARPSPNQLLLQAKAHGATADTAQASFRQYRQTRQTASGAARGRLARAMFRQAVKTVVRRNRELTALGGYVATADVRTARDDTYFWSGDQRSLNGRVTRSAMATAQHIAAGMGGSTVEMTPGGGALEHYAGHPSSFGYLQERFRYTEVSPVRSSGPHRMRETLIERGARQAGTSVRREVGTALYDRLRNTHTNTGMLAHRYTAAGALWDVMSVRFAKQARGDVRVIHAASRQDPYFRSRAYRESTWRTRELPTLRANGARVTEHFAEDLGSRLQRPTRLHVPNWRNTGGYRPNLPAARPRRHSI